MKNLSCGNFILSFLILLLYQVNINAYASEIEKFTLMIFESKSCDNCKPLHDDLEYLQQAATSRRLVIIRHVMGDPESVEAFTQHQVTSLPEYILLDKNQQVIYEMKDTINFEKLLWEIKENLGLNETVRIPEIFEHLAENVNPGKEPVIVLFWSWDDPKGQELSNTLFDEGIDILGEAPTVLSFNSKQPHVIEWMNNLGIAETPAYLVISENWRVYRKSSYQAQSWQLKADLKDYAERFSSQFQTIPVGLRLPLPDDGYILPATIPLPPLPASDVTSPP